MTTTKNRDWYVDIHIKQAITEDAAFDLMGDLDTRGAAITLGAETFTISLTGHGETAVDALMDARKAIEECGITGETISASASTYEELDQELERPLFPDVVGWAEVAKLAGVTRQRARQFRNSPGFPAPVIETTQGPLMAKSAVEHWVRTRDARPGRRPQHA